MRTRIRIHRIFSSIPPLWILVILATLAPVKAIVAQDANQEAGQEVQSAASLDELLDRVRSNWRKEQRVHEQREAEFKSARQSQARLLDEAKATHLVEETKSDDLEARFEENEQSIAELEERLESRLGNLGELFGIVRQVAGDTGGQIESSLVSSQFPGREEFLARLGRSKSLPAIDDLERLYATLLQEMVESGKVTRFAAPVVAVTGTENERDVVRVGAFNVIAGDKYLVWSGETRKLSELGRQPAAKYLRTVSVLDEARDGFVPFALDPARGAILQVLIKTPSFLERIQFGGGVGYTIIGLGVVTGGIGLLRLVALMIVGAKVRAQRKNPEEPGDNPLGRVLSVYKENASLDNETLELKLDEKILQETGKLERFLWMIKVVSAVAPLMGLLGTVTGMIRTFQIITLFGTGDPKLMAGGISEALVTTMLGLVTAIPLVLLHSWLASIAKTIVGVLEEQATGLVAAQAEAGAGTEGGEEA